MYVCVLGEQLESVCVCVLRGNIMEVETVFPMFTYLFCKWNRASRSH